MEIMVLVIKGVWGPSPIKHNSITQIISEISIHQQIHLSQFKNQGHQHDHLFPLQNQIPDQLGLLLMELFFRVY